MPDTTVGFTGPDSPPALAVVQLLRERSSFEQVVQRYKLIAKPHPDPAVPLVQLSYTQTESPMASPVVQECRGLILERESWSVIAMPFKKFFNHGEKYAASIDCTALSRGRVSAV